MPINIDPGDPSDDVAVYTKAEVDALLAQVQVPPGLTEAQVRDIVAAELAEQPTPLTEAQVRDIVAEMIGTPPPDTTAPSAPTNFTATTTANAVNLAWSASTDATGVVNYVVSRSGGPAVVVTGLSHTDTGLSPGTYTYTVAARDAAGNTSPTATVSATIAQQPPPAGEPLLSVGVYSWNEAQTHKTVLKTMNAPIIRIGGAINDGLFSALLELGSKVMWTANGGSGRGMTYNKSITQTEIKQHLDRYGPNGTYFTANPSAPKRPIESVEVWNEPNFYLDNWSVNNVVTAGIYKNIINDNSPYIRQNWPGVKVVGPSVANASSAAEAFIRELFKVVPDLGTKLDAFSVHYYTAGGPPEVQVNESWGSWSVLSSFASIKNLLNANGCGHLPIWNTEIGWGISNAEGGFTGGGGVTKLQQAAYNVRADIMSVKMGHKRMYHMFLVDTDGTNTGYMQANSSFPDPNAQPRPVLTATKHMISLIGAATAMEILTDGGPWIYRFTTPTGKVVAAWSDTATTRSIPISGTTTVTDMLGNQIATPTGTSYSRALTYQPIWVKTN